MLILGYVRPNNILYLVEELIRQDSEVEIYISIDRTKDGDFRKILNEKCIADTSYLLKTEKIRGLFIAEKAKGCYQGVFEGVSWFFKKVGFGLILEEDLLVHPEIVQVCRNMCGVFKNNENLGSISLYAPRARSGGSSITRFHKTNFPSSWGWLTTQEKWSKFRHDFGELPNHILWARGGLRGYRRWRGTIDKLSRSELDSWAYRWLFTHWIENWYTLTPSPLGFIRNAGFDGLATHTKRVQGEDSTIVGEFANAYSTEIDSIQKKPISKNIERNLLKEQFGI